MMMMMMGMDFRATPRLVNTCAAPLHWTHVQTAAGAWKCTHTHTHTHTHTLAHTCTCHVCCFFFLFFFLLQDAWPFAVSASTTALYANDSEVRGRQLPWGRVEVDNPDHSDFVLLRNLLIRTHMQDLIETTNNVHYEHYRRQHLSNVTLEQSLE